MKLFLDVSLESGKWITIQQLNFFDREVFYQRLLKFDKLINYDEYIIEDVTSNASEYFYNTAQILRLFGIDINDCTLNDINKLLINPALITNFVYPIDTEKKKEKKNTAKSLMELLGPSIPIDDDEEIKEIAESQKSSVPKFSQNENYNRTLLSCWNVCNSITEALFLLTNIPAPSIPELLEKRGEILEKAYATPEDQKKKWREKALSDYKQMFMDEVDS